MDKTKKLYGLIETCNLYKQAFNSIAGQEVLRDLESRCYFLDSTIAENPIIMAFKEGQRANFLHIKNMVDMDVDALEKLNPPEEGEKEQE